MRLLVFPASLDMGGSQLNAIELAGALQRRDHDVWVFGPEGPLCDVIDDLGLRYLPAPSRPKVRPSPHVMTELIRAVRRHRIDIVHGYEWPPILEAVYGPFMAQGTTVVGTIMSMGVAPFIPRHVPLAVGTARIAEAERARRADVSLIEPPVDTDANRPWTDVAAARAGLGAQPGELLVVVVSRLAEQLKREGILTAVRAAADLARDLPLRMIVVGDGPARADIAAAAAQVNREVGRAVVTLTGSLADPRPAYAAADIVFGMGGSALRAMAFGKPLIVQGELGFWKLLTADTLPEFLHQGWYGVGDGSDGTEAFTTIVRELAGDPARRAELGRLARDVVVGRFSLDQAAAVQEEVYRRALAATPKRFATARRLVVPAAQVIGHVIRLRWDRYRGTGATEDFNALSAQPTSSPMTLTTKGLS